MIFHQTDLSGVFIIEPELIEDERGFFACAWIASEFEQHGLNANLRQSNIAFNARRGTIRGMHFQRKPHQEARTSEISAPVRIFSGFEIAGSDDRRVAMSHPTSKQAQP